jgi:hypothetical protein
LAEEDLSDSEPSIQTSTDDGAQVEEDEEPEIPPLEFDFVLVGAGTASYNAMREIVTHMPDAKVRGLALFGIRHASFLPLPDSDCWR